MQGAGGEVEGTGVQEQKTSFASGDGGEFGKANVVADCNGDFAVGRDVDEGEFIAGGEDIRFPKSDFAWDVDIEEVDFSMGC